MSDRDRDLVHLFVRDLDDIELPARDRWRPARRRESQLMKTSRYVLYAGAVAAVLVLALIASFGLRDRSQVAATPSPTSPTSSPTGATGSPSASPSQTAPSARGGGYIGVLLGYSMELPPPWHRTTCAPVVTQQSATPGGEELVSVAARDETGTDIGVAYPTVRVLAEANPQNLTPRQWAAEGRTVGGTAGERIEDVVYADRPAARKGFPGRSLWTYFVANGGRMYVVDPFIRTPPDAATEQTMVRIIDSFRFLTDAEQAAARAVLPPAVPARTPEQVADGVAAALTAKDADALAAFFSGCVVTGGEQAGGSFVSREKYVDDLRAAFTAGLVVTVQPRPLSGDRATGNLTIASTWQDSRGTKERKLMLVRGENERWEWLGTLERLQ